MTRILAQEMGIDVVLAGTYCKYDQEWFREQVSEHCDEVLISDEKGKKVKRNTEKFARDRNINEITPEGMYAAKETVGTSIS